MITWTTEKRKVSTLKDYTKNPRKITEKGIADLKLSMERLGYIDPIAINLDGTIIGGHARKQTLKALGLKEVDVRVPSQLLTPEQVAEAIIRLNKNIAGLWDYDKLANEFELSDLLEWGFTAEELGGSSEGDSSNTGTKGSLSERFMVPPFTVLNAREGWWQDRKRYWFGLGIKSELGRGNLGTTVVATDWMKRGTDQGGSIFDPVLCEIAYLWFSPPAGIVIDPFAGGSVRGIVAAKLGRQYVGGELRKEQVEANQQQATDILEDNYPVWHCADSRIIHKTCKGVEADLLFSCPPYADLEVYSDDPKDISTLAYAEFKKVYAEIIKNACTLLKDDRFAVFVVGEVRDKHGNYYNFIGDTIEAFKSAGLSYYNEAILVTSVGSLPIRAGKQFSASRKLGKTHQNILVFLKGNAKKAVEACGVVEIDETLLNQQELYDQPE